MLTLGDFNTSLPEEDIWEAAKLGVLVGGAPIAGPMTAPNGLLAQVELLQVWTDDKLRLR